MKTLEYRTIDKTKWPRGPGDNEPDKKQWLDADTGLPWLIVRHPRLGHLCGYVGVPPSHPLHGKSWDDAGDFAVHYGLTFSDKCQPHDNESMGICHPVEAGEEGNIWWFGFDAAH